LIPLPLLEKDLRGTVLYVVSRQCVLSFLDPFLGTLLEVNPLAPSLPFPGYEGGPSFTPPPSDQSKLLAGLVPFDSESSRRSFASLSFLLARRNLLAPGFDRSLERMVLI